MQSAAFVEVAPPDLLSGLKLLCHVLGNILADALLIPVQLDRSRKAKGPVSHMVNDFTLVPVSAVPELDRLRVNQPVKMDCPILVELWDDDIAQPLSPYPVVQPNIQLFDHSVHVIAVYPLFVER